MVSNRTSWQTSDNWFARFSKFDSRNVFFCEINWEISEITAFRSSLKPYHMFVIPFFTFNITCTVYQFSFDSFIVNLQNKVLMIFRTIFFVKFIERLVAFRFSFKPCHNVCYTLFYLQYYLHNLTCFAASTVLLTLH